MNEVTLVMITKMYKDCSLVGHPRMEGLGSSSKVLCGEAKLGEGLVIHWKQKKLHSVRLEKKIAGNWELGSEERSHLISEGLAQIPLAQGISSIGNLGARDVAYYQGDVPGSTSDPNFPGTGLNEFVPTPACLKDGDSSRIVRKKVD